MITAPFRLDQGLFLETRQILLPWDVSIEQLGLIGSPESNRSGKTTFLTWRSEKIFDGIAGDIHLQSDLQNRFTVATAIAKGSDSVAAQYATILAEITAYLGSPHQTGEEVDVLGNAFPQSAWIFGRVEISLVIGERFMEYVNFVISCQTSKQ